jgi:hypothetical protein
MSRELTSYIIHIVWNVSQIIGRIKLDANQGALLIAAYTVAAVAFLALICFAVWKSGKSAKPDSDIDEEIHVIGYVPPGAEYVSEFLSEMSSEFTSLANKIERGDVEVYDPEGNRISCRSLVSQSRDLAAWLTTASNEFKFLPPEE